jgi:23S rRNA (guanosine2251-2'-O)-methyltransferase
MNSSKNNSNKHGARNGSKGNRNDSAKGGRKYSGQDSRDKSDRSGRKPAPRSFGRNTAPRTPVAPKKPVLPPLEAQPSLARPPLDQTGQPGSPDRLEGRNPILEAIKAGRTINKLWVAKREDKPDPGLLRLISLAREAGAVILEVDRIVLDKMAETHGHQGVIAQVAVHEYAELDTLIPALRERGETPFLVILDELQESYNLGSILRIADAAGVHAVIIPQRRSVGLDAAVAKASAGAIEHVPVCRVTNISQTVERLKEDGFWITGTDSDATLDYRQADWSGALAILIGGEGAGISPTLKKHCDFLVSIPMHGQVNSLNAAVAAGIIVFEAAGKRSRATGQPEGEA